MSIFGFVKETRRKNRRFESGKLPAIKSHDTASDSSTEYSSNLFTDPLEYIDLSASYDAESRRMLATQDATYAVKLHTVRPGDTIASLNELYSAEMMNGFSIESENLISGELFVGQILCVPLKPDDI